MEYYTYTITDASDATYENITPDELRGVLERIARETSVDPYVAEDAIDNIMEAAEAGNAPDLDDTSALEITITRA